MKLITNYKTTIIGLCILILTAGLVFRAISLQEFLTAVGFFAGLGFVLSKDIESKE